MTMTLWGSDGSNAEYTAAGMVIGSCGARWA